MSLINDALKQANQARPGDASAAGPPLRPVEPAQTAGGPGFLLPAIIATIFAVAVVLLLAWYRSNQEELKVHANSLPQPAMEAAPTLPASIPATVTPPPVNASPENLISTETNTASEPTTNQIAAAEPPKPATVYKLQSIFYRAKNSSAVINGKTLFLGGSVSGARVVAIDQESVTIVTAAGQTNLLELSD